MTRVEWELYGTTNADAVTDKTVKSLNGIEKNAKRVETAFSLSVSSIFLRFLGPMALLQTAINSISESMEKAKQKSEEGFNTLAAGEDKYASAQQSRMAAFFKAQEDEAKAKDLSLAGRKAATEKFMDDRGFWAGIMEAPVSTFAAIISQILPGMQDATELDWVQKGAADDWAKAQAAEGKKMEGGGVTGTAFKSPDGFGNVIGVGANPVLENMTRQLEEQQRQTALLEMIANMSNGNTDFTKEDAPGTTFRATPYGL
jgi:hypothetical protein